MKNIKQLIGEKIRLIRKNKGLSQEALGHKAELHYTYIGGIERGEKNCSIDTLNKIADALQINIAELFSFPISIQEEKALRSILTKKINQLSPDSLKLIFSLLELIDQKENKRK